MYRPLRFFHGPEFRGLGSLGQQMDPQFESYLWGVILVGAGAVLIAALLGASKPTRSYRRAYKRTYVPESVARSFIGDVKGRSGLQYFSEF